MKTIGSITGPITAISYKNRSIAIAGLWLNKIDSSIDLKSLKKGEEYTAEIKNGEITKIMPTEQVLEYELEEEAKQEDQIRKLAVRLAKLESKLRNKGMI